MPDDLPHFLLFAEARVCDDGIRTGRWRFQLQGLEGDQPLGATSVESETDQERLELLAVVRGLEALDQPSRVTLVTASRYVGQGVRQHLSQWEESNWQWERFGRLEPIRDRDLWRRLHRALGIHRVQCRVWRFDAASNAAPEPRLSRTATIPGPHFPLSDAPRAAPHRIHSRQATAAASA